MYIATRDQNEKFRNVMANLYGTKPEETACLGCMQDDSKQTMYGWCKVCPIRECVRAKEYYSCHQCDEWPCSRIEEFAFATGRRVMDRAIPIWREKVAALGDEEGSVEWVRAECARYHCSSCGAPLFRGAQTCRSCKNSVADELDGSI